MDASSRGARRRPIGARRPIIAGGSLTGAGKDKRHPIQVVARRTGLSADVLRAWEKRYGILKPARSSGGRRLYSDADIEYLRLLRRATAAGRGVGQVAALSRAELEGVVREDESAAAAVPGDVGAASAALAVEGALGAVGALDGVALESALRRAMIEADAFRFLEGVVVPLLARTGHEWREGRFTPAHEHVASAIVRRVLGEFTASCGPATDAPRFLVATPQGQRHEFGAMLAAAAAAALGWHITYLGADLPAAAIADAARRTGAAVVGLSLVHPADDPAIPGELAALRAALAADTMVLAGGTAASSYARALQEIRAVVVADLGGLRTTLASLAELRTRG